MASNSDSNADAEHDPAPSVAELAAEVESSAWHPEWDECPIPEAPGSLLMRASCVVNFVAPAIIALGDYDPAPHGKLIMDEFERLVGGGVSPGTLYPALHDLEEEGALTEKELVRVKPKLVDDEVILDEHMARYEARLRWYLALVIATREELDYASEDAPVETDGGTAPPWNEVDAE